MADNAPTDPCRLAYVIFYWLGTGSLLPWNFFITVDSYWKEKFRNTSLPENEKTEELTPLQVSWSANLAIASMIPNVLFLFLNAFIGHKFRSQPRLLTALILIIVLFIFSDVMTKVNTDDWQYEFLAVTLFTVVLINIMVAIFQGGLSGLAGKFPPSYMGAVVQGQALGGIFAAATNVIVIACGAKPVPAAFADFLIAVIFLMTALVAFIILTKTDFYQHYANEGNDSSNELKDQQEKEAEQLIETPGEGDGSTPTVQVFEKMSTLAIVKRIWIWIAAVFLCFFSTLAVFPAITALVESTEKGKPDSTDWNNTYFIPVGCFLIFNVGDYLGRMFASLVQWPKATHRGSIFILLLSMARLAFIPLFLFCNAAPNNRVITDAYIKSDAAYLIFISIFALTNGYVGSIAMMFGPKMFTNGQDQGRAASLLVSFLVLGLAVGAAISNFMTKLL